MTEYFKITSGFVTQHFINGICRSQKFEARRILGGDDCHYEFPLGTPIDTPGDEKYQPYYMDVDNAIPVENILPGEFEPERIENSHDVIDQACQAMVKSYTGEIVGTNLWVSDDDEVYVCVIEPHFVKADPQFATDILKEEIQDLVDAEDFAAAMEDLDSRLSEKEKNRLERLREILAKLE